MRKSELKKSDYVATQPHHQFSVSASIKRERKRDREERDREEREREGGREKEGE